MIIISDHGFRPRTTVMARLRPNVLLEAMGHLAWGGGEAGMIDYGRTRAFFSGLDAYGVVVGISVNVAGRQPNGIVPADSKLTVARQVAPAWSFPLFHTGDR